MEKEMAIRKALEVNYVDIQSDIEDMYQDIDDATQLEAYYLWEDAGKPDGRDLEFWIIAQDRVNMMFITS
jgi:hypothetical protein